MKAIEQYFPVVMFIMLYMVPLTFEPVGQYFAMVLLVFSFRERTFKDIGTDKR